MILKTVVSVLTGALLLAWSGGSFADEYKPGGPLRAFDADRLESHFLEKPL